MKTRLTILALAVAGFATPALAEGDDATIYSNWDMYNSIYVMGDVFATGEIDVSSESAALVDQDQATEANGSFGDGDNSASVTGDALTDALGNIGANIASGVGNAQANDAALASVDGDAVFASAMFSRAHASVGWFNSALTMPCRPMHVPAPVSPIMYGMPALPSSW